MSRTSVRMRMVRNTGTWPAALRRLAERTGMLAVGIFLFVAACHLPTLFGDFIYDSIAQILYDDFLHRPETLTDILRLRVLRMDVVDRRRPLNLLSLALDARIWGWEAFGYRLTNILLHAVNGVWAFLVTRRLLGPSDSGTGLALLAALAFSLHPVTVEAVAEVTFREDLLATGAVLAAWWLAETGLRARSTGRALAGAGAAVLLWLASLAKETGWLGPLVVAIHGMAFRDRRDQAFAYGVAVAGLLGVVAFALYARAVGPETSLIFRHQPSYPAGSLRGMTTLWPRLWAFQWYQLVAPWALSADYGPYSIRHFAWPVCLIIWVSGMLLITRAAMRDTRFREGWAVYMAGWLPVSNLVPLFLPLADRYLYMPWAGAVLMLASWIAGRSPGMRAWLTRVWALLVVVGLGFQIHRQWLWGDAARLWADALRKNPWSAVAANNLAAARYERGQRAEAREAWIRATYLRPDLPQPWMGLALVERDLGNRSRAVAMLRRAIELEPRYGDPEMARAALLLAPWYVPRVRDLLKDAVPRLGTQPLRTSTSLWPVGGRQAAP